MRDADVRDADVRDAETVASITAGDRDGLAAAYDRYAPGLYAYCHSLLGEPAAVSDAVRDTFIVAAAELGRLGDPGRLRPWLYAVARNECRYRLRTQALPAAPGEAEEAGEAGYDTVDEPADAETAELRAVHHHDWSEATRDKRWKMISGRQDPFRAENDYSTLEVTDRRSGQRLFKASVPALTRLWISSDSRYFLGLS